MSRLAIADRLRVGSIGLRARRLRAGLSGLGIAIGTAAIVGVLGLSSSSQAGLLAEIDRLGTNLLTLQPGQRFTGGDATLPADAPARLTLLPDVERIGHTGVVSGAKVYRNPQIPAASTGGLRVQAASTRLLAVLGTEIASGRWFDEQTAALPITVLGAGAAHQLGAHVGQRIWLGGRWFDVAGILEPSPLAPDVDGSALVGYPAARRLLGFTSIVHGQQQAGAPSTIYVRTTSGREAAVAALLARTANPEAPNEVAVSQPSDALAARAAAKGAFNDLFLGLGVVALVVGAVGVANIMVISMLERRSEIGLRRSLGATRAQIREQFLTESILLSMTGGVTGVVVGAAATAAYASSKGWAMVIPMTAWAGGIVASVVIGAVAGLVPAIRASRLPPTDALRSV